MITKREKAIVLTVVIAIFLTILVNAVFVSVRTAEYVVRQHLDSKTAYNWAVEDLQDMIHKLLLLPTTEQEDRTDYWEQDISINKYIDIVGCTSLK